ncbi:hypothetical protein M0P65_01850 [Candidatus Gracilibacteria bacterium]|nr:hypothetical protein [Candidatus Gracilibacteria bacterium]
MGGSNTKNTNIQTQSNEINSTGANKKIKSTSLNVNDILELTTQNPVVKVIYDKIIKSIQKTPSKKNNKQTISVVFDLPTKFSVLSKIYSEYKKDIEMSPEEFQKILNYTVRFVLSKLQIKPKWEQETNQDNKIIKIGHEEQKSTSGIPKRKIKFFYSEDSKYLRIDGFEPVDDTNASINTVVDYSNEPQKNKNIISPRNKDKEEGQIRYKYVGEHTKLLEISKPFGGKNGVDATGKLIEFKKGEKYELIHGEGIVIEEIPNSNRLFYYSSKSGFVQIKERLNKEGIIELSEISVINKINVPNLDFDISLGEDSKEFYDKNGFVEINVGEEVINGPHRLRGNLMVGGTIKTNVEIDGNIKTLGISGIVGQPIKISSTGSIETSSINGTGISSQYITLKNLNNKGEYINSPITGDNNTIHANAIEIINLSLKGNVTIDVGEDLFENKERLTERIERTKKDISIGEEEFKKYVEQIEHDLRGNYDVVSRKISAGNLSIIEKVFSAIRSLLYLEPFQIDNVMKFLDYLHDKHEFDFIWGYKIKFNHINHIYNVVKKNKEKLSQREEELNETKKNMNNLVIYINGNIERLGELSLQYGEKIISKKGHIINKKKNIEFNNSNPVNIYKKYCIETDEFKDISKEEAEKILSDIKQKINSEVK